MPDCCTESAVILEPIFEEPHCQLVTFTLCAPKNWCLSAFDYCL